MKEYLKPEVEFVTFVTENVTTTGNISGEPDGDIYSLRS